MQYNNFMWQLHLILQQDDALPMRVREDAAPGTEIGSVTAVDDDVLENAAIDYMIICEPIFFLLRSSLIRNICCRQMATTRTSSTFLGQRTIRA
jgi:hypothetical protein